MKRANLYKQTIETIYRIPFRVTKDIRLAMGADALDWQNLLGVSKILDKICLCQIFNLSSVGALIHSKIFVNHKFQWHGNEHYRLLAVRRKGCMRSQESSLTASIEYVASAFYCLCFSFFFPPWIRLTPAEAVATSTMPVEASPCSTATFSGPRTSILRLKIEIKFSWLTFSFKSWRVN